MEVMLLWITEFVTTIATVNINEPILPPFQGKFGSHQFTSALNL